MQILNLGCGVKACPDPRVVNIDWSIYLRLKRNRVARRVMPHLLRGARRERFATLPDNIVVHDLRRGIPFADNSVDAVYHSHLLEHLDRDVAPKFLREVQRVLKPGGIQRIVVPDLEIACRNYLSHLSACLDSPPQASQHDRYVGRIIEQCVRREGLGATEQAGLRRVIDNLLLGDARRRGETHQWMYDRVNLPALLLDLGFRDPQVHQFDTSSIPDWNDYGLDRNDQGEEYKPTSLYIEAFK